jgi:hypothetical protein
VSVQFSWIETPAKSGERSITKSTDANGLFSLEGEHGPGLDISISKSGYYTSHKDKTGFNYALGPDIISPDPLNPVIFHLQKKGQGAELIQKDFPPGIGQYWQLHHDGTPIQLDLLNGSQSVTGSGQLKLEFWRDIGDVEQSLLRDGNVHSAKDWRAVLAPIVARYQGRNISRKFRADAAFANPELYEYLESEGFEYAIRLPANDALQRDIEPLLTRPVGRPSNTPVVWYAGFLYQAKSWNRARRVVAKVEWHNGELFPRVGFIVTNLTRPAKRVVRFYNQRGTAEQWIKEGKNAVKWTRLSCHDFVDNQVRLQLFVLAYNLGNFLRQAVLPPAVRHWTLTTLREKLIKIGAKVVRHSRKIVFQMAEVAVPRELFQTILERIGRLRLATAMSG